MINQFCLLLQTIQCGILLGEGRVLNNLETNSLHTVASVCCLQQEQNFSVKLFKGGDLPAVLPTGFGKSLIF